MVAQGWIPGAECRLDVVLNCVESIAAVVDSRIPVQCVQCLGWDDDVEALKRGAEAE